jgi:nucleoside-diphosphate-sugar epimerase
MLTYPGSARGEVRQRVLITGGSGRLGHAVAERLARTADVAVLDMRASAIGDVECHTGSVLDASLLARAAKGADAVVHAAALLPRNQTETAIFETNVMGTWNALAAAEAAGCRRFVLVSSECATGLCFQRNERAPAYLPVDEDHPLSPSDAYSLSKQACEVMAAAFGRRGRMAVTVLRPLYILFDIERDSISRRQDLWHQDLWGYVDPADIVDAVAASLRTDAPAGPIFVGAPDTLCEEPTLELVRHRFGVLPPIRDPGYFQSNPNAAVFDSRRARVELGITTRSTWKSPTW